MATQWLPAVEPTTDGFFLWHVVPGFATVSQDVTTCRTTHPEFCESMRLFGIPKDHAVRLEKHGLSGDGFVGPHWRIVIAGRSFTGAIQYRILDRANPSRGLTKTASGLVGLGTAADDAARWYLVPAPPFGWDIVHVATGFRLNAGTNGSGVELSPALSGLTHWDIVSPGRTKGGHHSHLWLFPFLRRHSATSAGNTPR